MNAPGFGVDKFGQRIRIGRFQLGEAAPIKHQLGQRNPLRGEAFQHIGTGAPSAGFGFLATGQAHFVKQDFAQLFGAGNIEAFACRFVNLGFHCRHFLRKLARQARQHGAVNRHAMRFHRAQHFNQWPLRGLINAYHMVSQQARLQMFIKPQGDIGIFRRIGRRFVYRHLVKSDLAFAAAQQFFNRYRRMAEIFLRQRIHAMPMMTGVERIRHQHGVVKAVYYQPITGENLRVEFGVLQNLFNRRVSQKRL